MLARAPVARVRMEDTTKDVANGANEFWFVATFANRDVLKVALRVLDHVKISVYTTNAERPAENHACRAENHANGNVGITDAHCPVELNAIENHVTDLVH